MTLHPKVAVVILNWNGSEDTLECLATLRDIDYPKCEVIVVDNASESDDIAIIETKHGQWVHIVRNERNYGFAEGNNIGIRHALDMGAQYVLLLNNDTIVAPDFLRKMVNAAQGDDSLGILMPTIYHYDMPAKVQSCGRRIGWYGPPGSMARPHDAADQVVYIEAASGACMLIKRKVIERIGLLCDEYFYQVEDTDYCARALRQGFRVGCVPEASIWHKGSASLDKVPASKLGYYTRNRFIFRTKYATSFQLGVFIIWFLLIEAPMNLVYYAARFKDIGVVKGLLWGAKEGFIYLATQRGVHRQKATDHDSS